MFKTIKTKDTFSKEEIKEMIHKYADTHYVSVDIKPDGYLTIWIGTERESHEENNK